jgi:transcriptional regulator with XRE-family HTH domain
MTQTEFGEALGVKRDVINNIENNRLKNPEKQEPIYRLMCEKFNVSEEWLRTGEGEMFAEVPVEDEYFKAVTQISKSNDKLAMQAIIEYWKLDDVSKETLRNYIYKIAEKSRE